MLLRNITEFLLLLKSMLSWYIYTTNIILDIEVLSKLYQNYWFYFFKQLLKTFKMFKNLKIVKKIWMNAF